MLVIPLPASATNRFPAESKAIDRGSVRPVATNAIRYPEATEGLTELVGVNVVEQLETCAEAKAMREVKAAPSAAKEETMFR